jgi:serine/threonine protein kinase
MSGSPVPSVNQCDGQSPFERTDEVIGRGAFSVVYKGKHRLTGQAVAIKVFKDTDDVRFLHTIKCFDKITGGSHHKLRNEVSSLVGRWSPAQPESEMASIRNESIAAASFKPSKEMAQQLKLALVTKELVVSLLDFSRGPDGKSPGKENGEYFIVMEMGDLSLEEYIEYRLRVGEPFTVEEIRSILYDVTRMVCLLHSKGLAHLDVKPANIMLFNSTFWKLIDFDGCFRAASLVDVSQTDIAYTPLYCAPEIAAVIVKMSSSLKVSRLMDVWSVGAIGAELVLMQPLLEQKYVSLLDKTNEDDSTFLRWLGETSVPLTEHEDKFMSIDPDLKSLIFDNLLVKEVSKRASLLVALKHPFLTRQSGKHSWALPPPSPTAPHDHVKTQRLFTLNPSELSLDLSNPLESDDAGAILLDSSADDDEHEPGLSPIDVTPMISPQQTSRQKTLFRLVCCKIE